MKKEYKTISVSEEHNARIKKLFGNISYNEAVKKLLEAYEVKNADNIDKTKKPSRRAEGEKKIIDVPIYMKLAMILLVVFVIILGIYPTFFVNLINTVTFG